MKRFFLALSFFTLCSPGAFAQMRTVKIGFDATREPMEFVDLDKRIAGFSADYMTAVSREAKFKARFVKLPWKDLFDALDEETIDVIAASVVASPELRRKYDFTLPYLTIRHALLADAASPVRSMGDLAGMTVGVVIGSPSYFLLRDNPDIKIKLYDTVSEATYDFVYRKVDAVMAEDYYLYSFLKSDAGYGATMKIAFTVPLGNLVFVIRQRSRELQELLNSGIIKLQDKNTDQGLIVKWLQPIETPSVQEGGTP